MRKARWIVAILFCLLVTAGTAQRIKFQNLDINSGLSQSSVNCIIQDKFGFMWIGTQDGLNVYDGYQFKHYKHDPFDSTTLSNNFINAIYESADGSIWIGTEKGLNRFDRNSETFERYPVGLNGLSGSVVWCITGNTAGQIWIGTDDGLNLYDTRSGKWRYYSEGFDSSSLPARVVRSLFIDSQGILWVGTGGGGLAVFNSATDNFQNFAHDSSDASSISNNFIWSIAEDVDGNLWVGTNEGLNRIDRSASTPSFERYYSDPGNTLSLISDVIIAVYPDAMGNIWLGTATSGISKLKYNAGNPVFLNYTHDDNDDYSLINNLVQSMFIDATGSVWVGTNSGIGRFDPIKQGFDHIKALEDTDITADQSVWTFAEDADEILWVGTRHGVTRIDRLIDEFHQFPHTGTNPNRKDNNSVLVLHISDDGTIWAGAIDGLFKLQVSDDLSTWNYEEVRYRADDNPLNDDRVYSLFEDNEGYLWIATREGLGRLHIKSGSYRFFQNDPTDPTSISDNNVRTVFQDSEGTVWAGTDGGGLNKVVITGDRIEFKSYKINPSDANTISSNEIFSIWEENGELWIGTYGGGLNRFDPKTGIFKHYTEQDGLSNNVIYGVLGDGMGNLWMSTNRGLCKFDIDRESFRVYEENDGLQSNEFNSNAYYRSDRGELFFGGINGFNAFFADKIQDNQTPPKVLITQLKLFGKEVKPGEDSPLARSILETDEIVLSYKENNLTIEFAALHYSYSGKNSYKYIMENLPQDTTYVVGQRAAYYTSLDPGVYVFKVWGSNSDGVWASEPRVLKITIEPPYWETWWFRILALVFIFAVAYSIYLYRITAIKRQNRRLEVLVDRRTLEVRQQKEQIEVQNEALAIEKDKVEKLLLNILPEETAEELKTKGKATARNYRQVTVMFTDIRNFTYIAEDMKPQDLVSRLDSYFVKFDEIIEKYGIEKIKTVGDAYLCAGGLPIRNKSNPIDTVLAGLEIQRFMIEANKELGDEAWNLRIGIHTGALIAGVIGTKRFAYDIWGDTVNIAQRMENSSEVGKVNVSGKTYEAIAPFFDCTYRGKIPAKNKGEIDMFFVDGIKPELSVDGLGIEPNEQFWKYVNLHLYSGIHYRNAEKHILKVLKNELPENLYYHGVHHMYDVCTAVERIAHMEGIIGEDLFLLKTAALYHDAGFVEQYEKNEPIGIRMAQEALPNFGYTDDQVELVAELIRATIFPHDPKTHLQQIMCDADLDYLGREDFDEISDSLRRELYEFGKIENDKQWDEMQVGFFGVHKYFTESSKRTREGKKNENLQRIKDRIKKDEYN